MAGERDLRVIGVGASPYTRKLRAALRFRRLPFRFVIAGSKEAEALPERPLPLVPYLVAPDTDGALTLVKSDTTPILTFLDEAYPERRLRPADHALRLLDLLIEDYGDEWLSKCMFHYRWSNAPDTQRAGAYLPFARAMQMTPQEGHKAAEIFRARQISRIGVVGSNEVTAPVIEASWRRFLIIFDAHIQNTPYLLGHRPGAGDFACFGQMTMLVITDPTPASVAFEVSPRAYAWTERCEDLSGLEAGDDDWISLSDAPPTFTELLAEIGRVHVPFLLANAAAVTSGAGKVRCEIDGQPWEQEAFVYQAKCLRWLREAYTALSSADRRRVDRALDGTGCEALFGAS
ncbi:MAG: glutathione S-transferase [Alphaproteobacteria bacterium]|nr:glutathione S-transferase [Alphaproteobacteria bacterium]